MLMNASSLHNSHTVYMVAVQALTLCYENYIAQ